MDTNKNSSWVGLLVLFTFASLVETMLYSQLIAFTPMYLSVLGVSAGEIAGMVGGIAAVSNAVGIPFLPFWGALADKYSRKPLVLRSFVVMLIVGLLAWLSDSLWVFVAARILTALALGNSGLMMTTLTERVPEHRTNLAFSIMNGAAPVGAFLGPLIGGQIVDSSGFPTVMLITSTLLLIVVLGMVRGYDDPYEGNRELKVLPMVKESVGLLWTSRRLRWLFPALFLLFGSWMLGFTYIPLVVEELYTGPDLGSVVGGVIGVSGITTLIISPILGNLADKHGPWKTLFVGAIVSAVLWPLPMFTRDIYVFGALWALLNGLISAVFAISFNVLSISAPAAVRGRIMSMAYMPVNIGFVIGPGLGVILTKDSIFNIFPAAGIMVAVGILALWAAYREPSLDEEVS